MRRALRAAAFASAMLLANGLPAQQVTVQQPVFRSFSASTTVSVPDRGSAFIGGVSRAADGRSRVGPFRSGTGHGIDREHAGLNVGVWIHDFEEMDRRLLGNGTVRRSGSQHILSGPAESAWTRLQARHAPRFEPHRIGEPQEPAGAASPAPPGMAGKADRYYHLGLEAERRGSVGVARSHYHAAARYGSPAARARLEHWESTAVVER